LIFFVAALPPALFFIAAQTFLNESPVYLASVGSSEKAKEVFVSMARLNGQWECASSLTIEPLGDSHLVSSANNTQNTISIGKQFATVFSPELAYSTVVIGFGCVCANFALYGHNYATPLVLSDAAMFPAAWQLLFNQIPTFLACLLMLTATNRLSRKMVAVVGLLIIGTALLSLSIAGKGAGQRSAATEVLFQYGMLGPGFGVGCCFTVLYQLSVEIYPTTCSATGSSIIMAFGRLGSVLAPQAFEICWSLLGYWEGFYGIFGVFTLCVVLFMPFIYSPSDSNVSAPINSKLVEGDRLQTYGAIKNSEDINAGKRV